jgi:glycosyltransferase involved in cell wall biosynthesis
MKNPEFSFIIPCYKSADRIARVIGSIVDQDYKDYEIICVLDGPDDIAESIIKSFPQVKYKVIEHGGACKARNEGFKMSSGKYVIFNDSDVYWRPGILRTLHDEFIKTPDIDIIYGGFRWTDMDGGHIPHEFDAHLLEVSNFIDTGNPVKREWVEKVGGWDESLKRWQDWDLFLRMVKAGAKGRRIPDVTRDTDAPKPGDISAQNNYVETYKIVRAKNKLPDRKVCVTSLAAWGHALRIAKSCDWDVWHDPSTLPNDYKAIYLLGMFPESVQNHVQLFLDKFKGQPRDCQYIIHWIGTDVLHMQSLLPYIQVKNIRKMFEKRNVIHLFQSKQNAEEMKELGFEGKVLTLPVLNVYERLPLPEKFTVAVYDHDGVDQKWHKWLVMELTKSMPDVEFVFFGNKNAVGKERNTEWLGRVPILDVIKKSSCLLRLTVHDGYPVAPIEFLFSGRKSILNVKDMPYANYVDLGVVCDDRIVEIKQLVYNEIRKVQDKPAFTGDEFVEARDYYESLLSPSKFKDEIEEIISVKA